MIVGLIYTQLLMFRNLHLIDFSFGLIWIILCVTVQVSGNQGATLQGAFSKFVLLLSRYDGNYNITIRLLFSTSCMFALY